MTYLVDANVLSEPTKAAPDARVIEWLRAHVATRNRSHFVKTGVRIVDPFLG